MRIVGGPRHEHPLLLRDCGGARLILVPDTFPRVAANPVEIPLGAITAVLGAPVFALLIRRTRARQGGWA